MRRIFVGAAVMLLACGCLSLSRQQLGVINQFAGKAENFTAYPEKIFTELAEIREARGVFYANSFSNPQEHLNELNSIVKERMSDDKIPGRVRLNFKILDDYAQGLVQLSSDAPFKTQRDLFGRVGTDLDELIGRYNEINGADKLPRGIGAALTQAMNMGAKVSLVHKRAKALRKFVNQADTMVSLLCDDIIQFLSAEGVGQLIRNEESGVTESFLFYFTKRSNPTIESEKEYIALMKRLEIVKQMRTRTIRATGNLKLAHQKLAAEMNRSKSIPELVSDLKDFCADVDDLRKSILKIR